MADFQVYSDRPCEFRWRYNLGSATRELPIKSSTSFGTTHSALRNFNVARFACGGAEVNTANDWLRLLICNGEHRRYKLHFVMANRRRVCWRVVARNGLIILASHKTFDSKRFADDDWKSARDTLCEPARVVGSYATGTRVIYEDTTDMRVHLGLAH